MMYKISVYTFFYTVSIYKYTYFYILIFLLGVNCTQYAYSEEQYYQMKSVLIFASCDYILMENSNQK